MVHEWFKRVPDFHILTVPPRPATVELPMGLEQCPCELQAEGV